MSESTDQKAQQIFCPSCHSTDFEEEISSSLLTYYHCKNCGTKFTYGTGLNNSLAKKYDDALEIITHNIDKYTDGGFDKAMNILADINNQKPDFADAFFYLAVCEARITLHYKASTKPGEETLFPSYHCLNPNFKFKNNRNFKTAVSLLQQQGNLTKLKSFMEAANRFDEQMQQLIDRSKNVADDYDVFICFKKTKLDSKPKMDEQGHLIVNEENQAPEYPVAKKIYDILNKRKMKDGHELKVFFSDKTFDHIMVNNYEEYIWSALSKSSIMIIVTSSLQNLKSTWVEDEWSRFYEMMEEDLTLPLTEKRNLSVLPITVDGFSIAGSILETSNIKPNSLDYDPKDRDFEDKLVSKVSNAYSFVPKRNNTSDDNKHSSKDFILTNLNTKEVKQNPIVRIADDAMIFKNQDEKENIDNAYRQMKGNKYPNYKLGAASFLNIIKSNPDQGRAYEGLLLCQMNILKRDNLTGCTPKQIRAVLKPYYHDVIAHPYMDEKGQNTSSFYINHLFASLCTPSIEPDDFLDIAVNEYMQWIGDDRKKEIVCIGADLAMNHINDKNWKPYKHLFDEIISYMPNNGEVNSMKYLNLIINMAETTTDRKLGEFYFKRALEITEQNPVARADVEWRIFLAFNNTNDVLTSGKQIEKNLGKIIANIEDADRVFKVIGEAIEYQLSLRHKSNAYSMLIELEKEYTGNKKEEKFYEKFLCNNADCFLFLGDFKDADYFYTDAMSLNPLSPHANFGKLMVEMKATTVEQLILGKDFSSNKFFVNNCQAIKELMDNVSRISGIQNDIRQDPKGSAMGKKSLKFAIVNKEHDFKTTHEFPHIMNDLIYAIAEFNSSDTQEKLFTAISHKSMGPYKKIVVYNRLLVFLIFACLVTIVVLLGLNYNWSLQAIFNFFMQSPYYGLFALGAFVLAFVLKEIIVHHHRFRLDFKDIRKKIILSVVTSLLFGGVGYYTYISLNELLVSKKASVDLNNSVSNSLIFKKGYNDITLNGQTDKVYKNLNVQILSDSDVVLNMKNIRAASSNAGVLISAPNVKSLTVNLEGLNSFSSSAASSSSSLKMAVSTYANCFFDSENVVVNIKDGGALNLSGFSGLFASASSFTLVGGSLTIDNYLSNQPIALLNLNGTSLTCSDLLCGSLYSLNSSISASSFRFSTSASLTGTKMTCRGAFSGNGNATVSSKSALTVGSGITCGDLSVTDSDLTVENGNGSGADLTGNFYSSASNLNFKGKTTGNLSIYALKASSIKIERGVSLTTGVYTTSDSAGYGLYSSSGTVYVESSIFKAADLSSAGMIYEVYAGGDIFISSSGSLAFSCEGLPGLVSFADSKNGNVEISAASLNLKTSHIANNRTDAVHAKGDIKIAATGDVKIVTDGSSADAGNSALMAEGNISVQGSNIYLESGTNSGKDGCNTVSGMNVVLKAANKLSLYGGNGAVSSGSAVLATGNIDLSAVSLDCRGGRYTTSSGSFNPVIKADKGTLTIAVTGASTIKAMDAEIGNGNNGGTAIIAKNMFLSSSAAGLMIRSGSGGKGNDSTSYVYVGSSGGEGGTCIISSNLNIKAGSVVFDVGSGGNGGKGGTGSAGYSYQSGSRPNEREGYQGGTGGTGGKGGKGGRAGYAFYLDVALTVASSASYSVNVGTNGAGGQGGNGGNGGRGEDGGNGVWSLFGTKHGNGYSGGNGGLGGVGGQGGDAYAGFISCWVAGKAYGTTFMNLQGQVGAGGVGGFGGKGGYGGNPHDAGSGDKYGNDGNDRTGMQEAAGATGQYLYLA